MTNAIVATDASMYLARPDRRGTYRCRWRTNLSCGAGVVAHFLLCLGFLLSLASYSIADSSNPAHEFLDGQTVTFSTDGHPKAKGINFTITYPRSWLAAEGKRPNMLQVFTSDEGRGLESVTIGTFDLGLLSATMLTDEEIDDILTSPSILPIGATLIEMRSTEIEASPASIIEYQMHGERAGARIFLHVWSLYFVLDETLVQIGFTVGGLAGTEVEISHRMTAFKPLFMLMANSIIFPGKWSAAP